VTNDGFRHVEDLLKDRKNIPHVQKLLDSDEAIFHTAVDSLPKSQQAVNLIIEAANVLYICRTQFSQMRIVTRSAFFITALAGQLAASPTLRETLLALKKCSSELLSKVLYEMTPLLHGPNGKMVASIQARLDKLLAQIEGKKEPLRSEHDNRNETHRTTIVASKVLLSRHKSNLSEQDAEYSKLLNEFHDWLSLYLEESLVDPKKLFMHELVLYELRAPHQGAFMPQTRHAVEQALFVPHDYLGCSCCVPVTDDKNEEVGFSPFCYYGIGTN
jgi:origin recognition complex subunit 3